MVLVRRGMISGGIGQRRTCKDDQQKKARIIGTFRTSADSAGRVARGITVRA